MKNKKTNRAQKKQFISAFDFTLFPLFIGFSFFDSHINNLDVDKFNNFWFRIHSSRRYKGDIQWEKPTIKQKPFENRLANNLLWYSGILIWFWFICLHYHVVGHFYIFIRNRKHVRILFSSSFIFFFCLFWANSSCWSWFHSWTDIHTMEYGSTNRKAYRKPSKVQFIIDLQINYLSHIIQINNIIRMFDLVCPLWMANSLSFSLNTFSLPPT